MHADLMLGKVKNSGDSIHFFSITILLLLLLLLPLLLLLLLSLSQ